MTAEMVNVSMDFLSLNFADIWKFKLGWNKEMERTYERTANCTRFLFYTTQGRN